MGCLNANSSTNTKPFSLAVIMETVEKELKDSFISFFNFSLSLIEKLDEKNGYLKFAVVNMQISLELFLKFYFIKIGKPEIVLDTNRKFKDFSFVLNAYFSHDRNPLISKKNLSTILESRNSIVHKGKLNEWDESLAEYIISCVFFIQRIYQINFEDTLIYSAIFSHKISRNTIWKKGAEKFANAISMKNQCKTLTCPECYAKAMVDMEIFNFDEYNQIVGIQCLSCFIYYDTENAAEIVECNACLENSFLLDKLNEQKEQIYLGLCLECDNKDIVRKCFNCESYYFPSTTENEVFSDHKFFCSQFCFEAWG